MTDWAEFFLMVWCQPMDNFIWSPWVMGNLLWLRSQESWLSCNFYTSWQIGLEFFWWYSVNQWKILYGRHESWVTCHDSGVLSHDLDVSSTPVNWFGHKNFWCYSFNQWMILHYHHVSWVTCHDLGVRSHDLAITSFCARISKKVQNHPT